MSSLECISANERGYRPLDRGHRRPVSAGGTAPVIARWNGVTQNLPGNLEEFK